MSKELTHDDVTEYGLADYIKREYPTLCHTDTYGWLHYNQAYWEQESADVIAFNTVSEALRKRQQTIRRSERDNASTLAAASENTVRTIRAVLTHLQNMTHVPIREFDASPDEINVANGVLNLQTGKLQAHAPSQRFTYCIQVPYIPLEPRRKVSPWERFLRSSVGGGPTISAFLQRCVGYTLTGSTHEEKMFYIYGPTRSGKGVFTETLLSLFGPILSTEVDFTTFTRERQQDANNFDLAPLKAARFLAASESSRFERLNEAKVKQMTGGNYIWCAFKYSKHFAYRPQYKIWLTSNYEVNADPNDEAVWGRIIRFDFPNSHLGTEDIALKHLLQQPEHQQDVLAWAVEGAMQWYDHGLDVPASLQATLSAARNELDTVWHWLEEETMIAPNYFLPNHTIRGSYELWCNINGIKPMNMIHLARAIGKKGAYTAERQNGCRGLVGLRLRYGDIEHEAL